MAEQDKPNPSPNSDNIPVLPLALGVGALLAGGVLLAVVLVSSKSNAPILPLQNDARNPWIRVPAAPGKVLGVSEDDLPGFVRGFRPARQILAPTDAFDIQQHEVTWEELDSWVEKNPTFAFPKPTTASPATETRKSLPAHGVPWATALEYCRSIGATLPTEEQWELAARGVTMNKFPWGNDALDWSRVQAFKGETAGPVAVMSSSQDRTPGTAERAIYDLAGNVQEWTFSVWRNDVPDQDESWVQAQGTKAYAIRGFPMHRNAPGRPDELNLAYRDWICAVGDCSPLSAAASAQDRARMPKMELWANADSTQPGALEWRRVLEAPEMVAKLTKCFSSPTSTTVTIKAAKEVFCKRPEQIPTNGACDGKPAFMGPLVRVTGGLPEATSKCVNYALHDVSVAKSTASLPEAQFSYALYVTTNPQDALQHVGFRCARAVPAP